MQKMGRAGVLRNKIWLVLPALVLLHSCGPEETPVTVPPTADTTAEAPKVYAPAPEFNPDSAYAFIKQQVDFGPRIPNTTPHAKCADWLSKKLSSYGFKVTVQKADATAFDGRTLKMKNIIAAWKPERKSRIL